MQNGLLERREGEFYDSLTELNTESSFHLPGELGLNTTSLGKESVGQELRSWTSQLERLQDQSSIGFWETYAYVAPQKVLQDEDLIVVGANGRSPYVWGDKLQILHRQEDASWQKVFRFTDFGDVIDMTITRDKRVVAMFDVPFQELTTDPGTNESLLINRHRLEVISFPLNDPENYSVLFRGAGEKWSAKLAGALDRTGSIAALGNETGQLVFNMLPSADNLFAASVSKDYIMPEGIKHLEFLPDGYAVLCLTGEDPIEPGNSLHIVRADLNELTFASEKGEKPEIVDSLSFDAGITSIAVDPLESSIAVGTRGAVGVYRLEHRTGSMRLFHDGTFTLDNESDVTALAYSSDCSSLALGTSDGLAIVISRRDRLYGVLPERCRYALDGDYKIITALEFINDNRDLGIGSYTRTAQTNGPDKGEYALRFVSIDGMVAEYWSQRSAA